ncbi:type I-E CRISPR-associated protein Cse1/CasA [Atlantibacter sp.]|uniref:type I-E CRISPR-associated protein Cse1/CasA n=1 Tax=Atlantibacter sp. TaxID=1903473 RepID=UPI0028A8694F|nr:type I-E CRISPR-associated protein Cse1/CasA [Atlantibacter sp.]
MDLLVDPWIPVRAFEERHPQTITLQRLCCSEEKWLLNLPRDDMELAALQLLICLLQVTCAPKDDGEMRRRVAKPLDEAEFISLMAPWLHTFQLDHPQTPFMQVKGVEAKEPTPMEKLMTGLSGATNCAFVNQPGQGEALCGGCTAIALFNQANNAPGFGGGFKSGLRGGTPITTLIKGPDLRSTLWLNVLTTSRLQASFPVDSHTENLPTWKRPVASGKTFPAATIGLLRGLFWQPASIELCPPIGPGQCCGCGQQSNQRYNGFLKAKFNFTVEGLWPHPHSPRVIAEKKGVIEQKFLAFTTAAPSWTQISRILVDKETGQGEGRRVAMVVEQFREVYPRFKLVLIVGGYRNNQASILERRHDVLIFNEGWQKGVKVIDDIVDIGLEYKKALRRGLYTFVEGIKSSEVKGAGVAVHEVAERHYYRHSELLIPSILASINYSEPQDIVARLRKELHQLCEALFNQVTAPYAHHPKLIRSLAVARASLRKHLYALQPQGELAHGDGD